MRSLFNVMADEILISAEFLDTLVWRNNDPWTMILPPANRQKAVTRADVMWILRIRTGKPGFIRGVVVKKTRRRRKWIVVMGLVRRWPATRR